MSYHRRKLASPPGVQLGLIITPMLDMSFQILAFFIMTYHPSALEGHIPGNLTPPEEFAKKSKDTVAAPVDPPSMDEKLLDPTLEESLTVQIKTIGQGTTPEDAKPGQIFLRTKLDAEGELLPGSGVADFEKKVLPDLEARLGQMGKGNKANLKIAADGGLEYQYVLMVYDAGKRAGFDKIHFVPPPLKNKLKSDRN